VIAVTVVVDVLVSNWKCKKCGSITSPLVVIESSRVYLTTIEEDIVKVNDTPTSDRNTTACLICSTCGSSTGLFIDDKFGKIIDCEYYVDNFNDSEQKIVRRLINA